MACTDGYCVYTQRRHGNVVWFLYVKFVLRMRGLHTENAT